MIKHILITGATGLVGSLLLKELLHSGKQVSVLSREKTVIKGVNSFIWDIKNNKIAPNCLDNVDCIVHLAGASIGEKRWTNEQKQNILSSRLDSTNLLFQLLQNTPHQVKHFISASAIGYYGDTGNLELDENMPPGDDFLAEVCRKWELNVSKIKSLDIATSILRFGIILHRTKGSLPRMQTPIRIGLGAALGYGNQWVSWIHHQDLISMLSFLIENPHLHNIYNATAPQPCTNKQLVQSIAKHTNRFIWPINVPKFALDLALGEMKTLVLNSNKAKSTRIQQVGFEFEYSSIDHALNEIYAD